MIKMYIFITISLKLRESTISPLHIDQRFQKVHHLDHNPFLGIDHLVNILIDKGRFIQGVFVDFCHDALHRFFKIGQLNPFLTVTC